jgi:MOSC domain-containing protein YiiM
VGSQSRIGLGERSLKGDCVEHQDTAGTVLAVCTSEKKGTRKRDVGRAEVRTDWGIVGDAHAADWHRQISLLAVESIDKMRALGLNVGPGSFAENITTQGIVLTALPIGTTLRLGTALVVVTQIGKVCHDRCAIYYQAGDCVMPREGIFVKVREDGEVSVGDTIEVSAAPSAPGLPQDPVSGTCLDE